MHRCWGTGTQRLITPAQKNIEKCGFLSPTAGNQLPNECDGIFQNSKTKTIFFGNPFAVRLKHPFFRCLVVSTWCLGHGGKRCPQRRHASAMLCNIGVGQLPQQVPHMGGAKLRPSNPKQKLHNWKLRNRKTSSEAPHISDLAVSGCNYQLGSAGKPAFDHRFQVVLLASGWKLNQEDKQNYINIYQHKLCPNMSQPNPAVTASSLAWSAAPKQTQPSQQIRCPCWTARPAGHASAESILLRLQDLPVQRWKSARFWLGAVNLLGKGGNEAGGLLAGRLAAVELDRLQHALVNIGFDMFNTSQTSWKYPKIREPPSTFHNSHIRL